MNNGTQRQDKKFRLKVRHLLLGAILVLMVAAGLHLVLLSNGVDRRLTALRAAGYPTSFAELALRGKLPMGVENAAPVYVQAFAAFVPPPKDVNVPLVGKPARDLPPRGTPLPEPMIEAIADCLAANEQCLALLHEAAGIENCRYDWDPNDGMMPHLSEVRRSAHLLNLAAAYHAHTGAPAASVTSVKDGLRLAGSLQGGPSLINYLVQVACTRIAIRGLERTLDATALTDAQLRDLHYAFAAAVRGLDFKEALVAERCFLIECTRNPSLMGAGGSGEVAFALPGVRSQGLTDLLDHMAACIEATELPRAEQLARFREVGRQLDELSVLHVLAKILAPALVRIVELDLRARVHLDLAQTALAIERHRLATGKTPDQLEELTPQYLDQVPIDPFDGQPIRYRRTDPGYVLYSITEDGQDNGGKEKEDVGKGQPYDLCFIVTR